MSIAIVQLVVQFQNMLRPMGVRMRPANDPVGAIYDVTSSVVVG